MLVGGIYLIATGHPTGGYALAGVSVLAGVVEVPVAVRAVRHPDDCRPERLAVRRGVVARQPERAGVDEVVEDAARLFNFQPRSERIRIYRPERLARQLPKLAFHHMGENGEST